MSRRALFLVYAVVLALTIGPFPSSVQAGLILFMSPSSTEAAPGSSGFFDLKVQLTDGESPFNVSGVSIQLDLTPQVSGNSGITFTEDTFPSRGNLFSEEDTYRYPSPPDNKRIGITMYPQGQGAFVTLTNGVSLTTVGFQVATGTVGVFDVSFNRNSSVVTLQNGNDRAFDNPGATNDVKLGELNSVPEPGTLLLTAIGLAGGALLTARSRIRRSGQRSAP